MLTVLTRMMKRMRRKKMMMMMMTMMILMTQSLMRRKGSLDLLQKGRAVNLHTVYCPRLIDIVSFTFS